MQKMKKIYYCFPGGRFKALTLSYDDGKKQDRKLVEIFNKFGIKATFNLNAGLLGQDDRISLKEVAELYQGHEVAAHTYSHPTIARCPHDQIVQQIIEDRKILEDLVGYPVRGLAYPNGSYTPEIKKLLPYCGIDYARIVGNSSDFSLPTDFYEWKATCHHNYNLLKLAEQFLSFYKKQYLYLMYVWGHSYEFDNDNNWDLIEEFCRMVGNQPDIWYATNIEIVDYIKALQNLKFSANGEFVYNPSSIDVWISVDDKIVKVEGGKITRF